MKRRIPSSRLKQAPDPSPLGALALLAGVLVLALSPARGSVHPVTLAPVIARPAADATLPPEQLVVRIRGGTAWLNGEPVAMETLSSRVASLLSTRPAAQALGESDGRAPAGSPVDRTAFLDADPTLSFREVVAVLDGLHAAGVQTVGLTPDLRGVLPPPTPEPSPAPLEVAP